MRRLIVKTRKHADQPIVLAVDDMIFTGGIKYAELSREEARQLRDSLGQALESLEAESDSRQLELGLPTLPPPSVL